MISSSEREGLISVKLSSSCVSVIESSIVSDTEDRERLKILVPVESLISKTTTVPSGNPNSVSNKSSKLLANS